MSDPYALDPDEGPTAWVATTRNGLVRIMEGTDPDDPSGEVALSLPELERALDVARERVDE